MKKLYSISEAAKATGFTAETLCHYDRIPLVKPSYVGKENYYRYYSQTDIVVLKAIKTLKTLDVSLDKIRTLLAYKDLNQLIISLSKLDKDIDDKIRTMKEAKVHLERARQYVKRKNK